MAPTTRHPLDELSAPEVSQTVKTVKLYAEKAVGISVDAIRWNVVTLQEPRKKELLAYEAAPSFDTLPPRLALVILHTPPEPGVAEVLVRLADGGGGTVLSWTKIEGVHALATPDDCFDAEALVKADPQVRALLEEVYGVTDMDLVACDPWSVHTNPVGGPSRCIQAFLYMRTSAPDNQYAHPLDMVALVDLNTRKIVRIDHPLRDAKTGTTGDLVAPDGTIKWNKENNNYHRDLAAGEMGGWRDPPKPLHVTQPQGPSFEVEGSLIRWQNWSFRLGFNYREGIVLHLLNYKDGDQVRPVAHRLSLVEMAVPYGDPREPYVRKCAFDVGDYGLGYCASSLSLGCDCLGHIRYFDAVWANAKGEPTVLRKAVCMHEEDAGLLWKHVEYRTGHSESRRSRRLVISSIATVVNYEYAFYWSLYQDGSVTLDIKLTGELSTNMLSAGEEAASGKALHGTLVGPGVNAQHHQHMFCARLDMAVDDAAGGKDCLVTEVNVEAMPTSDENPFGNGFKAVETILGSTTEAQRVIAPEKGRIWKVVNPAVINAASKAPVGYKLVPAAHPPLLAQPDSIVGLKGNFASKQLWVTPYSDTERFPAGEYVFNANKCTGLTEWTKKEKSLLGGADPVIWYSFGATHIVRPEDFPVMPCEVCSFALKPSSFFTRNPGTNLPPERDTISKEVVSPAAPCCGMTNGTGGTNGSHAPDTNGSHAPGTNGHHAYPN